MLDEEVEFAYVRSEQLIEMNKERKAYEENVDL